MTSSEESVLYGSRLLAVFTLLVMGTGVGQVTLGAVHRSMHPLAEGELVHIFNDVDFPQGGPSITHVVQTVSSLFLSLGALLFVGGVIGTVGALCHWGSFLISYLVVSVSLIVASTVGVVMTTSIFSVSEDSLEVQMLNILKNEYSGNVSNKISAAWDRLFIELHCCGVYNSSDIELISHWKGTITVNNTVLNLVVPLSCCKGFTDSHLTTSNMNKADWACAVMPHPNYYNSINGCAKEIRLLLKQLGQEFFITGTMAIVLMSLSDVLLLFMLVRKSPYQPITT